MSGDNRGDLGQAPTPEAAAAELRPEHPVLLNHVLQHCLLALSDPARKGHQQEPYGKRLEHAPSVLEDGVSRAGVTLLYDERL